MKDTAKVMLESEAGFGTTIYSKNRQILDEMQLVSENVRQLTGFTADKVIALTDGNNIYIEFANNLERFMQDAQLDLREAVDEVMYANKVSAQDANIIVDESCVDRINMEEMIQVIGKNHILRK